jgi:predicted permease
MPDWRALVASKAAGALGLQAQGKPGLDPATETEVIDEFVQHLEDCYRDALARGATETEATQTTLAEIDAFDAFAADVTRFRQPLRAVPRPPEPSAGWLAPIAADARFAWRRLWHAPGFTLAALATLVLAIGANTAVLSVADAVLFRPLPYAKPDRVFALQMENRATGQRSTLIRYAFVAAIDAMHPKTSELGLIEDGPHIVVASADGPEIVPTVAVSASYLSTLGIQPVRGRVLDARDSGSGGQPAMLSFSAWRERFDADESIIGRAITIGDSTFDLVGILPPAMFFPTLDFLVPGQPAVMTLLPPVSADARGGTFRPVVRLAPGATREQAQAAIDAAVAPVAVRLPDMAESHVVLENIRDLLYPVGRPILRYLLVAAALILVIGCANLANMMFVRARRASQQTAVRLALGASRARLIRPMLFEGLFLGLAGAGLALLVTWLSFDALLRQIPRIAYGSAPVGVDARVVMWSLLLGLAAAVAFSVVPAWRAARVDVLALLQHRGTRGGRMRFGRPLVAVQVSLAIVVVFGAAVAARAFVSVLRLPLGFSTERVIRVRVVPPRETVDRQAFYERLVDAIAERPDVVSAAAAGAMPFSGQADELAHVAASAAPVASIVYALPGYFETMGVPTLRGRAFASSDLGADPDAAVVSASAARAMFAGRDPLGATFDNGRGRTFHVVGVVGDVRKGLDRADERQLPAVYVMPGASTRQLAVVARTRDRSEATLAGLKADVHALVPATRVTAEWLDDVVAEQTAYRNPRLQTVVLGGFAALGLVLTAVGIFSVVAYLVAARVREMGVRVAMGATPRSLVGLIVRQALVPVAVGVAVGLVWVRWASQLAEAQLFDVDTHDPRMVAAAVIAVVVAAVIAAYLPARRATRVDPITVLRAE